MLSFWLMSTVYERKFVDFSLESSLIEREYFSSNIESSFDNGSYYDYYLKSEFYDLSTDFSLKSSTFFDPIGGFYLKSSYASSATTIDFALMSSILKKTYKSIDLLSSTSIGGRFDFSLKSYTVYTRRISIELLSSVSDAVFFDYYIKSSFKFQSLADVTDMGITSYFRIDYSPHNPYIGDLDSYTSETNITISVSLGIVDSVISNSIYIKVESDNYLTQVVSNEIELSTIIFADLLPYYKLSGNIRVGIPNSSLSGILSNENSFHSEQGRLFDLISNTMSLQYERNIVDFSDETIESIDISFVTEKHPAIWKTTFVSYDGLRENKFVSESDYFNLFSFEKFIGDSEEIFFMSKSETLFVVSKKANSLVVVNGAKSFISGVSEIGSNKYIYDFSIKSILDKEGTVRKCSLNDYIMTYVKQSDFTAKVVSDTDVPIDVFRYKKLDFLYFNEFRYEEYANSVPHSVLYASLGLVENVVDSGFISAIIFERCQNNGRHNIGAEDETFIEARNDFDTVYISPKIKYTSDLDDLYNIMCDGINIDTELDGITFSNVVFNISYEVIPDEELQVIYVDLDDSSYRFCNVIANYSLNNDVVSEISEFNLYISSYLHKYISPDIYFTDPICDLIEYNSSNIEMEIKT